MAPYISSHLCDNVCLVTTRIVHPMDIHENLVANTRSTQSAMRHLMGLGVLAAPSSPIVVADERPADTKTSGRKASVLSWLTQAGPPWPPCWQIPRGVAPPRAASLLDRKSF